MAKTKKKPEAAPVEPITPERVHELLGLPGPTDPQKPPRPWKGCLTLWDPGLSVRDLRKRHPGLFVPTDWYDGLPFARATECRKWRQFRLEQVEPGTFAQQLAAVRKGDRPATAREAVTLLAVLRLASSSFPGLRLRTADVLPSGRRVVVGPMTPFGLDLANVSDAWASPAIGLLVVDQ